MKCSICGCRDYPMSRVRCARQEWHFCPDCWARVKAALAPLADRGGPTLTEFRRLINRLWCEIGARKEAGLPV